MPTEPEQSDDYGYDLAHEARDALRVPVARKPTPGASLGSDHAVDQDGDLGYDDCHEIPVDDRAYRL